MQAHKTNTIAAIDGWLSHLNIPHAKERLQQDLLSHPDYPSLYSVNQVLERYGVANTPVEAGDEYLDELPPPFIAYMNLLPNGNDFALVTRVYNGSVQFTNKKRKPETITRDEFINRWRNVAVIKDDDLQTPVGAALAAAQKTAPKTLAYITATAILVAIILAGIGTLISAAPLITLPGLLFKTIGLATTVVLPLYEVNNQNETVKQFCSAGKTINCEAVLQSKGAKIGGLGWSEADFAYFAGTLLYSLFFSHTARAYPPLAVLSVAALPYTFYSIYYQYKIVKQWCLLCLVVQGVILAEGLFALFAVLLPQQNILFTTGTLPFYGLLIALMALPLIIWLLLKPQLKQANQHDNWKYAYMRLQNNPEVFNAMLRRQAAAPDGYKEVALCINKGIVLPDGNKPRSIIKICNPFCGPCAAAHPVLEALAEKYGAELYILFLGDNSEADKRVMVARHFMALYQSREETLVKEAMHWWYSSREKSRELLTEKYPIDNENYEAVQDRFTKMQDWNTKAEITFTPTIYVDGYRLPQMYTIKQLEQLFGYE